MLRIHFSRAMCSRVMRPSRCFYLNRRPVYVSSGRFWSWQVNNVRKVLLTRRVLLAGEKIFGRLINSPAWSPLTAVTVGQILDGGVFTPPRRGCSLNPVENRESNSRSIRNYSATYFIVARTLCLPAVLRASNYLLGNYINYVVDN